MALDLGEGRFPMDTADPARYFANDTRSEAPSLIFEGVNEDLNGNGQLDWGEDTDNDGYLDRPNTWPLDGDPREDLLTFYELQSNTLILRLVAPLAEETTYAVVLTDRLTGTDGQVVTSPWEWVHHTGQTHDLMGLHDALPLLGLGIDNVAFAWTFTTGRQTGDLVDIQRGLNAEGPFASLAEDYPTGVQESLVVHEVATEPNQGVLPVPVLMESLVELGLFDEEEAGPHGRQLHPLRPRRGRRQRDGAELHAGRRRRRLERGVLPVGPNDRRDDGRAGARALHLRAARGRPGRGHRDLRPRLRQQPLRLPWASPTPSTAWASPPAPPTSPATAPPSPQTTSRSTWAS